MNTVEFWQGFFLGAIVNCALVVAFTVAQNYQRKQQARKGRRHD